MYISKKNGVTATHISISAGHSCVCTEDVINVLQLGSLDINGPQMMANNVHLKFGALAQKELIEAVVTLLV